jgi:hypothetical protein
MKYFLHAGIKIEYQQRVTIEAYDAIIQQLVPNTMPSICPKNESRNNPYKLSRGQLNPVHMSESLSTKASSSHSRQQGPSSLQCQHQLETPTFSNLLALSHLSGITGNLLSLDREN